MKKMILYAAGGLLMLSLVCSCSRKVGCPSDGKNVGAEKLINGEKAPKSKKFKD